MVNVHRSDRNRWVVTVGECLIGTYRKESTAKKVAETWETVAVLADARDIDERRYDSENVDD